MNTAIGNVSQGERVMHQAREWLVTFLLVSFSALAAVLDRFDLVGTGSGFVLTTISLVAVLLAVASILRLGVTTRRIGGANRQPRRGLGVAGQVLAVAGGVLASAIFIVSVSGGLEQSGWLHDSVVVPPLFMLLSFVFMFISFRSVLTELTQTQLSGWVFIMPALLLMLVWIYLPAVNALWISLFKNFNYLGTATFVGLENYAIALRDPLFIKSLVNTSWYVVGTVPRSEE